MPHGYMLDDSPSINDVAYVARWLRKAIVRVIAREVPTAPCYKQEELAAALRETLEKYKHVLREIVEIEAGTRPGGRYWKPVEAKPDTTAQDADTWSWDCVKAWQ